MVIDREKAYTRKYYRKIYKLLASTYWTFAKEYEKDQNAILDVKLEDWNDLLTTLYSEIVLTEARIYWKEIDSGKKDIIDDLVGVITGFSNDEPVTLWRSVLSNFLEIRIGQRITEITETTRKHTARVIQKGIDAGLGGREIARLLRKQQEYNKNRALMIARTETITSMNQGSFMAANSKPFVVEKKWSPTIDARTRLSHRQMIDQEWRDLDKPFFVANQKGFLEEGLYPCDNEFTASNIVNCRCRLIYRAKRDESGRIVLKNT